MKRHRSVAVGLCVAVVGFGLLFIAAAVFVRDYAAAIQVAAVIGGGAALAAMIHLWPAVVAQFRRTPVIAVTQLVTLLVSAAALAVGTRLLISLTSVTTPSTGGAGIYSNLTLDVEVADQDRGQLQLEATALVTAADGSQSTVYFTAPPVTVRDVGWFTREVTLPGPDTLQAQTPASTNDGSPTSVCTAAGPCPETKVVVSGLSNDTTVQSGDARVEVNKISTIENAGWTVSPNLENDTHILFTYQSYPAPIALAEAVVTSPFTGGIAALVGVATVALPLLFRPLRRERRSAELTGRPYAVTHPQSAIPATGRSAGRAAALRELNMAYVRGAIEPDEFHWRRTCLQRPRSADSTVDAIAIEALNELDLQYARGRFTTGEYLQRAADFGERLKVSTRSDQSSA